MAKKTNRELIVLKNPATGTLYYTRKNKINTTDKLSLRKFDKVTRRPEKFVESKVKFG